MKKILSLLIVIPAGLLLQAQDIDRSKAPQAGPAPVINIGDPASFVLPNGLKVFVVRNTKLPQVSATLTLDVEAIAEGPKAGLTDMAGTLMRYGTSTMKKEVLDEAVDFLGGNLSTSATTVSASSLSHNFPKLMQLMSDVVLRPSFPAAELEKIRKQTLSNLQANAEDPSFISGNISKVLLYGRNHPYGEIETEASVKRVTLADVKNIYTTYWKPNIAYLVFVGDITPDAAKKMATQYFGAWKPGPVAKKLFPAVTAPAKTYVAIVDRPSSVQSVINIVTPVMLKPGTPNAIPASVMNAMLGGGFSSRLMQNLREKHGFTYGTRSSLNPDRLVGSFSAGASVRNEKTDSAIAEFLHEFNLIRLEQPKAVELSSLKNYMSGGFARKLENPATIAGFALNTALYKLPKDYYRNYLTRLASVSPGQVQQMAQQYLPVNHLIITIVGNAKEIAPGLEKYGEVKYFDANGNPKAAPELKKAAVSISGEEVLRKALQAYGSEAAIAALKDASLSGSVSMMGQNMQFEEKHVFPSAFSRTIKMGDMTLMSQQLKNNEAKITVQGNEQVLEGEEKERVEASADLFAERYFLQNKYVAAVKGIEKINGQDAYEVELTSPSGSSRKRYYEVKSGLPLRELSQKEGGPNGPVTVITDFQEYKTIDGLKIASKMLMDLGKFKQEISVDSIKLNQGLKETDL